MMDNQTGKNSIKRTDRAGILVFVIAVAVIMMAVFGMVVVMKYSVNESIYSERKALLGDLSETSANVINDNLSYIQSVTDIITDNAEREAEHYTSLKQYIKSMSSLTGYSEQLFFFVDSEGGYYSSDGVRGKLADRTYYTASSDDKLSYISSLPHLSAGEQYLIFRNRLERPLTVNTDFGTAELVYCGLLYNIDLLNETVSLEFSGANNTFIYDDTSGVMLYKKFEISQLIDGFNIYNKLHMIDMAFGDDPAELEQSCRNQETVVAAFNIGDAEYYFCSAPIEHNEWSVAFIVQSKYLNEVSGNAVGKIVLFITLIAIILGAAIVLLIVFSYKNSITKRSMAAIRKLNRDLDNATRAKSDFLSNMSHDIRTPINGIMGMVTIAKSVEGNPEKTVECLNKIEGVSNHLLSLINDILDMSRIERGKIEITHNPLEIGVLCDNCNSIISGQMSGREINFITSVECEHSRVLGDDLHLKQILINILGNAVKFTRDGGTINFNCREIYEGGNNTVIEFEIEDTGIGMNPEFLEKIFDAFSQDAGGARSEYKGTGLGMAITKQLTELMNGTIDVESKLGKGSKFTVRIPFEICAEVKSLSDEFSGNADISGVKVLLAEDNELNMEIACELLGESGAVITSAADGQKAVELFENNPPGTFDVILMDVMMPVMNGLEATQAIRALQREDAKTIPILAMTANAFESDIRATKEAGMNAHLSKPINIEVVVQTIDYHVRKQRT